jgi:hypothetical protein
MGLKVKDIEDRTSRVEGGGWVKNLPNLPGVSVKVKGSNNSEYRRRLGELVGELSAEERKDKDRLKEIDDILLAETVLVDWDGIDDLEYSPEAALELLTNPKLALFREGVIFAANVVGHEGRETLEDDVKNS